MPSNSFLAKLCLWGVPLWATSNLTLAVSKDLVDTTVRSGAPERHNYFVRKEFEKFLLLKPILVGMVALLLLIFGDSFSLSIPRYFIMINDGAVFSKRGLSPALELLNCLLDARVLWLLGELWFSCNSGGPAMWIDQLYLLVDDCCRTLLSKSMNSLIV